MIRNPFRCIVFFCLQVLEKKHKEEMERMVSEAAQDRLKMQNSSEKERLALEETRYFCGAVVELLLLPRMCF